MQAIGKKSVASLLSWIISAAFFVAALSGGLTLVLMVVLMVTSSDGGEFLVSAWPVWVDQKQTAYQLVAVNRNLRELALNVNQGSLHFSSTGLGYYAFKLMDAAITIGLVVVILDLLRQVFATLSHSHPFTSENARKLWTISVLILLIAPYNLLKSLVYYLYITRNVAVQGGEFLYWSEWFRSGFGEGKILIVPEVDFLPVLIGLVLLVVAELFRIGAELQADKESII